MRVRPYHPEKRIVTPYPHKIINRSSFFALPAHILMSQNKLTSRYGRTYARGGTTIDSDDAVGLPYSMPERDAGDFVGGGLLQQPWCAVWDRWSSATLSNVQRRFYVETVQNRVEAAFAVPDFA